MKNKKLVSLALLILIALFIGAIYAYKNIENKKVENVSTYDYAKEPFVRAHSPSFGDNEKNIYVVEFLDPECESCALFHKIIKKFYKENYKDIKLVVRYLANHKNSDFAIKILEASRLQNKYNEVLETIYKTQGIWADHNNEKPQLLWDILSKIDGLNIEKIKQDMNNPKFDEIINIDRMDAQNLYVRGTPAVFINGKKLLVLSPDTLDDLYLSIVYK